MGLFDVFDSGKQRRLARKGFEEQKALKEQGIGRLEAGGSEAQGYQAGAKAPYQALSQTGQQGIDYYGQLVGLPGAGGGINVQETLRNIPGYQFSLDQGLEGLNRAANARGMLASGNNTQDILRFSQGLADQNYFNYLNTLNPYFNMAGQGAQGLGQIAANQSNIATGTAGNVAGVYSDIGNNAYQMRANQAAAEAQANQNLWGAILGLANAGARGVGAYYGA